MVRWILAIFCFFSLLISGALLALNFWSMWFYNGLDYHSTTTIPPATINQHWLRIQSRDRGVLVWFGFSNQTITFSKPPLGLRFQPIPMAAGHTSSFKFEDLYWNKTALWTKTRGIFHFEFVHRQPAIGPTYSDQDWVIEFPLWALTILTGAPALFWIFYHRRHLRTRWRKSRGLCLVCGYDLRATPNRCPECGTVPDLAAQGKSSPP